MPSPPFKKNVPYFQAGGSQLRLDLTTEGDLHTWGFREAITWGDVKGVNLTLGADIAYVGQGYNEFDSFNFSVSPPKGSVSGIPYLPGNFGIPVSHSVDPGIFLDGALPVG